MSEEFMTLPSREVHWLVRFHTAVTALIFENPALERLVDDEYDNVDPEMVSDLWEAFLEEIPHRFSIINLKELA